VLKSLRNRTGEPGMHTRVVAAVVLIGLVILTAPIVVVPVIGALLRAVF
jgi:uncharacterized membrane protein